MTLFVGFDLETTGLNPKWDEIVTAAVVGHPSVSTSLVFRHRKRSHPNAEAVHGITGAVVSSRGVDYPEALRILGDSLRAAWDMGAVVCGHNITSFDFPLFLAQERRMFGSPRTEMGPIYDTVVAYRKTFPGRSARLASACEHLGVHLSDAHEATSDAEAARVLAYRLTELSGAGNRVPRVSAPQFTDNHQKHNKESR